MTPGLETEETLNVNQTGTRLFQKKRKQSMAQVLPCGGTVGQEGNSLRWGAWRKPKETAEQSILNIPQVCGEVTACFFLSKATMIRFGLSWKHAADGG